MTLLSTILPINAMWPMTWGAKHHGTILKSYFTLLLVELHKTKSAAPGALWRWRKWGRQAVHVIPTVTVITEEQLILLEQFRILLGYTLFKTPNIRTIQYNKITIKMRWDTRLVICIKPLIIFLQLECAYIHIPPPQPNSF